MPSNLRRPGKLLWDAEVSVSLSLSLSLSFSLFVLLLMGEPKLNPARKASESSQVF